MIGFYAKSNVGNLRFGYHYRRDNNTNINQYWHDIVLNNEFTFYTIPFQKITDNELDKIYFMFGGNSGKPFDIEIKQLKFEKGTIATDWTPAPEDLQTEINSANAKLDELKQTMSHHNGATASRIDTLAANLTTLNNQSIWQVINNTTDLNALIETGKYFIQNINNPNSPTPPHWLFVEVDKGKNERIKQTVIQDNNVKNQWVRHCLGGNWGQWDKIATGSDLNQKADAVALNSLTTKVSQVDGKITAEAQKVSTLQTTVNGQTASIQQQATSIDGLKAQYTVKIDSGGRVSGFGLASGGNVSDFAVRADKFYIAPPSGDSKGASPFMVLTEPQTINGTTVPAGTYIRSAYIHNGSIDVAKIKDGSINNAKIANGAITSAKIANAQITNALIANGAITSAKIGNAQVDTLQIAGEAVIVPRLQFSGRQEFREIDREVEINRLSLDAKGGAVSIAFGFESLYARAGGDNDGNNGRVILRLKRGSTVLRTLEFAKNGSIANSTNWEGIVTSYRAIIDYKWITLPTFYDRPPSGEQIYTITLESRGLNAGKSSSDSATYPVVITARSLHIMGVKR